MTPEVLGILTNREVIALDQDTLGRPGKRISETGPQQIWIRPLADGSTAIALFNGNEAETVMHVDLTTMQLPSGATLCNLWDGSKVTAIGERLSVMVPDTALSYYAPKVRQGSTIGYELKGQFSALTRCEP